MTKQDYELISTSVRQSLEDVDDFGLNEIEEQGAIEVLHHVLDNLATQLEINNPRFDRNKFMRACGVKE